MPNIKLIIVKGGSGYCSERLSIGVYVKNNIVTLIDSGIDDGTAKAVDKMLKQHNLKLGAIINTHSHADHCGGNNYFQRMYPDVKIYSTKYERHFIEDTKNEPRCFCQGAEPNMELRNKFLEAQNSVVTDVIHPYIDQELLINGEKFRIMTLPGHSPGMIGVISPDNVFYAADSIFGQETLDKHAVLFYTDIEATLHSFEKIAASKVDHCVFYHGGLLEGDLLKVIDDHKVKVLSTLNAMHQLICQNNVSLDELTRLVMKQFSIPQNVSQYTLTQVCVQAYVTKLQADKKIEIRMSDGLKVISAREYILPKLAEVALAESSESNSLKIKM